MKGSSLLKVTGILMIIGGAVSVIMGLIAVLGSAAFSALVGSLGTVLVIASVVMLAAGAFELVAGIAGVKNCKDPAKAHKCVTYGIIVVVLYVLSYVMSFVSGGSVNFVSMAISFVIPVLYIVGAMQVKGN